MSDRQKKRSAILVVGMHRSGTSALARVLNIIGCDLPATLLSSNPTNERGHWESRRIVFLNDELLASAGSSWHDWNSFNPQWYASPIADRFREHARTILEDEYGDSRLFVLKDPRICRLLPFWLDAVRDYGAEPFIISPIRNPLDVATSLETRDGIDSSIGHLLWLRHVLDAEKSTRGFKRAWLRYDTLLSEPHGIVDALGDALDISWPKGISTNAQMEIDEFISQNLRHHLRNDAKLLGNPRLSHWIKSSFDVLDRWARGDVHDKDVEILDRIRSAFDAATPAFSRALTSSERALTERDEQIQELNQALTERNEQIQGLNQALTKRDEQIQGLNQALTERDEQIQGLNQALTERDEQIQGLNQALTERDEQIQGLNQALTERDEQIQGLYGSTSWRITAPLRHLRRSSQLVLVKTRAGSSWIARAIYRRTPLPLSTKIVLKQIVFRLAPALFRHTEAYRNWETIKRNTASGGTVRDCAFWGILTTPHTLFVAKSIERRLRRHGWDVHLMMEPPDRFFHDFYVVICPQIFKRLPPYEKLVSFQMEQSVSSRWFTAKYLDILSNSFAVLEYATHNFSFLKDNGISYPHVNYVPIGGECYHGDALSSFVKTCDVLFYGANLSSPRRQRMLSALRTKFDVRVKNDTFGPAMEQAIRSARVVVNIHYFEDALLEVPRIWECLSVGTPVVSEAAKDQGDYPELEDVVEFFDEGSVASMLLAVEEALEKPVSKQAIHKAVEISARRFSFMFDRFLIAMNFLPSKYASEIDLPIPESASKVILSMPETHERRRAVLAERRLDGWVLFDGIRRQPGWVGCGLSYHVLARHAILHDMGRLVIAEDDVFLPEDFSERFETVNRFLDQRTVQWDMFCGLISDLHENTNVLSVEDFEGMTFVTIDKMTSTVFNIYNRNSLQILASWNFENLDPYGNTIDRFIENHDHLRIVVTIPFLVRQNDNLDSLLWGFNNTEYSKMIMKSENRLRNMISTLNRQEFMDGNRT